MHLLSSCVKLYRRKMSPTCNVSKTSMPACTPVTTDTMAPLSGKTKYTLCLCQASSGRDGPVWYIQSERVPAIIFSFPVHRLTCLKSTLDTMNKSNLLAENENDLVTGAGIYQAWHHIMDRQRKNHNRKCKVEMDRTRTDFLSEWWLGTKQVN